MADFGIAALLGSVRCDGNHAMLIEITAVRGSTPREPGAAMVVTADSIAGTIGGGHLEFHAIDVARAMLEQRPVSRTLDMELGPLMGQCCGGQVSLSFEPIDTPLAEQLMRREQALIAARPPVLVFGLGHTGRALAAMLNLLPFALTLVDDRSNVFADLPIGCRVRHLQDPAEAIMGAPPGAAYVILTHSHALDYRLTEAALLRGNAAYVGMIGSRTKRRRFESQFLHSGGEATALAKLVCPIGGTDVDDKRPEIIAALTAAELVRCFTPREQGLQNKIPYR
jgi:xanthine dehydrogenase accessory factor